jgi:hypothetical protein
MPEHPHMLSRAEAAKLLRQVALAWVNLGDGVASSTRLPTSKTGPVQVQHTEAPAPMPAAAIDGRREIESFVWTYVALLSRAYARSRRCQTASTFAGRPPRGASTVQLLAWLVPMVEHPSAMVAWRFREELEELAFKTRWAVPTPTRRVSLGVPCTVDACDGVYEVAVPLDSASARSKAEAAANLRRAVCSVDDSHHLDGRQVKQ